MRTAQLLSVLSAISLAGFLFLYLYRAEFYALTEVSPASISDLYPAASDSAAIIDFKMTRESHVRLRLHNLENCRTWRILLDGKLQGQVCGLASGNQAAVGAGQVPMRCGLRIK